MKAIVCEAWGLPNALIVQDLPDPTPGPEQVVISIQAAGVNLSDVQIIQNKYQLTPELPFTPGSEIAGIVSAVGEGVTQYKIGDRVIACTTQGGFAQQIAVPVQAVTPMAAGVDFDGAAAITLTYGASHHAIVGRAQLKAGETMLVLGAASGIGLAAIEIGKALGARVIAAAHGGELEICKASGADVLINYSTRDLRYAIQAATDGRGPDVIFDSIGGVYAEPAFRSIAWSGRYLVVGFTSETIPKFLLNLTPLKGASLIGVFWGEFTRRESTENRKAMRELMDWLGAGKIRPHISGRYALADTSNALNDVAAQKAIGKIIIKPYQ